MRKHTAQSGVVVTVLYTWPKNMTDEELIARMEEKMDAEKGMERQRWRQKIQRIDPTKKLSNRNETRRQK